MARPELILNLDRANAVCRAAMYSQLLYNKKVCLVGGAPDVSEPLLETADLVVRVNDHWLRSSGRCDILYLTGAALKPALLCDALRPEFLFYSFNMIAEQQHPLEPTLLAFCRRNGITADKFLQVQYQHTNPIGPYYEWANVLHKRLRTMPFTGTLAACHLLRFPLKQLALTGFSFYVGMNEPGKIPYKRNSHIIPRQIEYFDELATTDARIVLDDTLRDVLGGVYPVEAPPTWMVGDQRFIDLRKKQGNWNERERDRDRLPRGEGAPRGRCSCC